MKDLEKPHIFFRKFVQLFRKNRSKLKGNGLKEWTCLLEKIIETMCGKDYSYGGHHTKKSKFTSEFLGVDANVFLKNVWYHQLDNGNIPIISIEFENEEIGEKEIDKKEGKLFYDFNKLFALNSKLKVLLGYIKLNKNERKDKKSKEIERIKEKFIKTIANYTKKTPSKYFPNKHSYFLIILGYKNMDPDTEKYTGFLIDEDGTYSKLRNN